MVNHKAALQMFWRDSCTVYVVENVRNPENKRTEQVEKILYEYEPCKLSFSQLATASVVGHTPVVVQSVKLFLDNEKPVPAGSKIEVIRKGKKLTYKSSGEPGLFIDHQEVPLDPFERWA